MDGSLTLARRADSRRWRKTHGRGHVTRPISVAIGARDAKDSSRWNLEGRARRADNYCAVSAADRAVCQGPRTVSGVRRNAAPSISRPSCALEVMLGFCSNRRVSSEGNFASTSRSLAFSRTGALRPLGLGCIPDDVSH